MIKFISKNVLKTREIKGYYGKTNLFSQWYCFCHFFLYPRTVCII